MLHNGFPGEHCKPAKSFLHIQTPLPADPACICSLLFKKTDEEVPSKRQEVSICFCSESAKCCHSIGLFLSVHVLRHDLWSQCGDGYGRGMERSLKSVWVLNPMGNNILKLAVCSHQAFFVLNPQKDLGDWVTCREVYLPDSARTARTELLWGKLQRLNYYITKSVKM